MPCPVGSYGPRRRAAWRSPARTGPRLAAGFRRYYTPSGRLIQRDYSNVSLYDYYYNRDPDANGANKEVKLTDGGRTVYGGGGITPDVKCPRSRAITSRTRCCSTTRSSISPSVTS